MELIGGNGFKKLGKRCKGAIFHDGFHEVGRNTGDAAQAIHNAVMFRIGGESVARGIDVGRDDGNAVGLEFADGRSDTTVINGFDFLFLLAATVRKVFIFVFFPFFGFIERYDFFFFFWIFFFVILKSATINDKICGIPINRREIDSQNDTLNANKTIWERVIALIDN